MYFGRGAFLISRKNYISVDISIMALSYRIIFCRTFCTIATKMKKLRIRRKITGNKNNLRTENCDGVFPPYCPGWCVPCPQRCQVWRIAGRVIFLADARLWGRGGGGHNERRRRAFSRGVWGHAPPEIFENLSL